MRILPRIFSALDFLSIILMLKPVFGLMANLQLVPDNLLSQARVWLTFPLFFSLFVSAIGLMLFKKFGFVSYYMQFPFRLILWIFSIGFITLVPEWLNLSEGWFNALFRICIVAEFFRLYFTVKIQRKYF